MAEWTAIVLAGERPGETGFAAGQGVSTKALIPVAGETMLARVVGTLLASPSIGRIVVLAQAPEALLAKSPAWLRNQPRIVAATAGDGISSSIAAIAGGPAAPWPILIATADHALLSPEMVETFLADAARADVAFAVVDRATVEHAHPATKRTWLKFSDAHYTGANLFALATERGRTALDFWARAERDRKKALKIISFFGPMIFLRALTRTISIDAAAARVGRTLGIALKVVRLPFAEAAIDVDKLADLHLAEEILYASGRGVAPLPAAAGNN